MDLFKNLENMYRAAAKKNTVPRNVLILGPGGVGKSIMTARLAKDLNINFLDLRLPQCEPTDLRGLFVPDYDKQETILFKSTLLNLPADWKGIILFDELTASPKMNLLAAYEVFQERRIGSVKIPDGAWLVAAGNRADDFAIANPIPSTIMTRFMISEIIIDDEFINNWLTWAITEGGIHNSIIAFLRKYSSHFFKAPISEDESYPCPRSWDNFSTLIGTVDQECLDHFGNRMLGKDTYSHYLILHKLIGKIKSAEDYLYNDEPIPSESDVLYLVITELISYLIRNKDKLNSLADAFNKLIKRMDKISSAKEALTILLVQIASIKELARFMVQLDQGLVKEILAKYKIVDILKGKV